MMILYNILIFYGIVLGLPFIAANVLSREKRRETVRRRLRRTSLSGLRGNKPVWVHAVSVGEVIASAPLLRAIRHRFAGRPVVLSVSTLTGHDVAGRVVGQTVDSIFFLPFDFVWSVRRAVRDVDPSLFILVESDVWPNLVFEARKRGVPFVLVSARMSPKSFRGYQRAAFFMKPVFSKMSSICAQTDIDARRFMTVGAPQGSVVVTGNIKFDQPLDAPTDHERRELKASLRIGEGVPVLLAGSTHEGEEAILLRVFKGLKQSFPALVLVLAPRDPARAQGLKELFQQVVPLTSLRSELSNAGPGVMPDAVIVDTIGELRRLYAVGDVVFVGKSLVDLGGQNPLEPAALGKPVLFGPHMFNFHLVAETLVREGGAIEVADESRLLDRAKELLSDERRRLVMGGRARDVFMRNRGAVGRTLHVVERFLEE